MQQPSTPPNETSITALSLAEPRAAYAYWRAKCGERRMPRPCDFNPAEIGRLLPYITLIDVLHAEHDYFYRIEGEAMSEALGFRRMGKRLSQLKRQFAWSHPMIAASYDEVCRTGEPTARTYVLNALRRACYSVESVMLPLSQDGARVDRIFNCAGFIARPTEPGTDGPRPPRGEQEG
jgi:hypothetical protein